MEGKNISELTVVELKSVAFDHLVNIENSQRSLQAINQELAKRNSLNGTPQVVTQPLNEN